MNRLFLAFKEHPIAGAVVVFFFGLQLTFTATWLYSIARQKLIAAEGIRATIFYQGKIAGTNNVPPPSGSYNMRFMVYTSQTGGTVLWTETWDGSNQGVTGSKVPISNGIFSVELNSLCGDWTGSCATNGGVNFNSDSLWLEVQFDPDGDNVYQEIFTPRKRLTAIPYALNADRLGGKGLGTSGNAIPLLDGTNTWSAQQTISTATTNTPSLIVTAATGQTANLQEWRSSTGAVIASISSSGALTVSSFNTSRITSTVTGTGGTPPAVHPAMSGYYKFDDGAGEVALDMSGGGRTAVFNIQPVWEPGYFQYTNDGAVTFTGSEYATIAHDPVFTVTESLSIAFWIRTTFTGTAGIVNKFNTQNNDASDDAYQVLLSAGQLQLILGNGLTTEIVLSSSRQINDGDWHHVVLTFERPTTALYIDGVRDTQASATPFDYPITSSSEPILIGASKQEGVARDLLIGTLDALAIYQSTLAPDYIMTQYREGAGSVTAHTLDTTNTLTGTDSTLLSIRSGGVEQASVRADGTIRAGGALLTLGTDQNGLVIIGNASQTANLIELRDASGAPLTTFGPTGGLSASSLATGSIQSTAAESLTPPAIQPSAQIAHWRFNDSPATSATDAIGGHIGSLQGATWATSGAFGGSSDYAISLDGSSGYVVVPHQTILNPHDQSFSVEIWVRPTAFTSDASGWVEAAVAKHDADFSNGYLLAIDDANGRPRFVIADGIGETAAAVGGERLTTGDWHLLVGTWDAMSKTATLYVDGIPVGVATNQNIGTVNPTADLIFGRYFRASQSRFEYAAADIDNPILWKTALPPSTIQSHYANSAGSATALTISTPSAYVSSTSKLLSLRNNNTEVFSVSASGGITSTGQLLLRLAQNTKGLLVYGYSGQTANLQEWHDASRSLYTMVNSMGLINAPALYTGSVWSQSPTIGVEPEIVERMRAVYAFNEGGGTTIMDDTVRANTGYAEDIEWVEGQFGGPDDHAIKFNGVSSAVLTPITLSPTPFGVEFWFKADTLSENQDIVAQTDASDSNPLFRINIHGITPHQLTFRLNGGTLFHDISVPIDAREWHHLAAMYTGTRQELYIDGRLVASAEVPQISGGQGSTVVFGRRGSAAEGYFAGVIDHAILWDPAPTAAEIIAHYHEARARTGLVIGTTRAMSGNDRILAVQNAGASVATISASGSYALTLIENAVGLLITASPGQTEDLTQWHAATGDIRARVTAEGAGVFTGITSLGGFIGKRTLVSVPTYHISPHDYILEVNVSGTPTITLPLAAEHTGQIFIVKDSSGAAAANAITIAPQGGDLIDGGGAITIEEDHGSVMLYSSGASWFILK